MRNRKLSESGDYRFGGGQLDFYRDVPEAVSQACKTRLLLWLGEFFLDTAEGTPYLEGILGKHTLEQANVTIQQRVLPTQGLTDLSNFESSIDPDTRGMNASFEIDTLYGPTKVQISNYRNY